MNIPVNKEKCRERCRSLSWRRNTGTNRGRRLQETPVIQTPFERHTADLSKSPENTEAARQYNLGLVRTGAGSNNGCQFLNLRRYEINATWNFCCELMREPHHTAGELVPRWTHLIFVAIQQWGVRHWKAAQLSPLKLVTVTPATHINVMQSLN